uniref:Uncharacterized protein n=1 Tax=Helianthus annuus TaxID=4232 RepID=A0A251V8I3_HELAN
MHERLNPDGDKPSATMYATASGRSDGLFLRCGGRDASGTVEYNELVDVAPVSVGRNMMWEYDC